MGILSPSAGRAPSCCIPLIVTEFGINVVLAGIALVKVIFVAAVFPVFVIVVVYVIVSPTERMDLSALFVVVNIALLIVVETVLDIFVCDTAGWLGSTTCEYCTELKFEIGFILGMFVTSTFIVIAIVLPGFIFPT
ncbi:hypothetical protein B4079_5892 [Bacillus cereus]|nr:hypothetical protein B4079_5892 [Bacillus cereus]